MDIKTYKHMLNQPWGRIQYVITFEQLSHLTNQYILDFGSGFGCGCCLSSVYSLDTFVFFSFILYALHAPHHHISCLLFAWWYLLITLLYTQHNYLLIVLLHPQHDFYLVGLVFPNMIISLLDYCIFIIIGILLYYCSPT